MPIEIRKMSLEIAERARIACSMISGDNLKVLDIGCGHGICHNLLKGRLKSYCGIDAAKYPGIKNSKRVDLNNKKLPFASKSFDAVICTDVLEHLFYPDEICEEIKRVLKPEGIAIISLPNEITIDNRIRCLFGRFPPKINSLSHHWFFTISEGERFIKRHFKFVDKKYIFGAKGGRLIPYSIRNFLASAFPSLFAITQIWRLKK